MSSIDASGVETSTGFASAEASPLPIAAWTRWGFPLLLFVLTAAAYANAAHDSLVYDDKYFVTDGAGLGLRNFFKLFTEDAWAATGTPSDCYRPLFVFSLLVEGALHGARPLWFHISTIGLQVATTLMLYVTLLELLRGQPWARLSSFVSSLIFGLHPVHTEVVNSVFNRSEMMATFVVLAAIWVVHRYLDTAPIRTWFVAALLYFIALLCRESAAALPLLLALMLVAFRPHLVLKPRNWIRLWPALSLVLVAVIYLLLRKSALAMRLEAFAHDKLTKPQPLLWRLEHVATMLRLSLRLLFVPYPLRANYEAFGNGGPVHAAAIHTLIIGSAVMLRRSAPGFLLGLAFFYLALLPSTRILTAASYSVSLGERYLYLPSVGLSLGLAFLLPQAFSRYGKGVVLGAAAIVCGLFFVGTGARNPDWRSDLTLWEAEARVAKESSNTWRYLVGAYLEANRNAEAARTCDQHLPQHDYSPKFYTHCGIAYESVGRNREAEYSYRRAVELGLGSVAHSNLGRFYWNLGRRADSEREYLEAIKGEYLETRQRYRRGNYLLRFYPQRRAEAALEFQRALELQPRYTPARQALEALKQEKLREEERL